MSAWTKEQWEEFCGRLGIDAEQALVSGKAELGTKKEQDDHARKPGVKKKPKSPPSSGVPYTERKQDPDVALAPAVGRTKPLVEDLGRSPRVRITIRGLRQRLLDPDNFIAGCKATLDGLCQAGIINDDSQKAITSGELRIDYEQQLVTAYTKEATEIEIEWNDV